MVKNCKRHWICWRLKSTLGVRISESTVSFCGGLFAVDSS
jgi:hypothetical protein